MCENKEEVDMKKIIACISLVFALSAGVTALAANDYSSNYDENNTFSLEAAETMNTILVTADDDGEVVYADQNDSTFAGATSFLFKGDSLAPGTYTVKMNNTAGNGFTNGTITIADTTKPADTDLGATPYFQTEVNAETNTYDAGYIVTYVENANRFTKVAISVTDSEEGEGSTVATIPAGTFVSGDSIANLGVKIINIPSTITINSVTLKAE